MKCERIKDLLLTDYTDGRLDATLVTVVDEHLLTCPACAALATAMRSQQVFLSSHPSAGLMPTEQMLARIQARVIAEESSQSKSKLSIFKWATALVVACLMVAAGIYGVLLYSKDKASVPYMLLLNDGDSAINDGLTGNIESYFL